MRYLLSFVAIPLSLLPAVSGVRAQSNPPAATVLLQQMRTAVRQAGSAHVTLSLTAGVTAPVAAGLTAQLAGDAAWKSPVHGALSGTYTLQLPYAVTGVPTSSSFDVRYVQNTTATRLGSGSWSCQALPALPGLATAVPASVTPSTLPKVSKATVVGPETVNGIAVWHVKGKAKMGVQIVPGASLSSTTDLYIAQSDHTLVRMTQSRSVAGGTFGISEKLTLNVSNYGEQVTTSLPASCSTG